MMTLSFPFPYSMAGLAHRGRISSVGRALDCRAAGRGFDSRGRTNTQGLKITEKWRYFLCPAGGWTFAGSDDHVKWRSRQKTSVRAALNFIALIPSCSICSSNVGKSFWSWILKHCIKVGEKKKKVVLCFRPRQKVKLDPVYMEWGTPV